MSHRLPLSIFRRCLLGAALFATLVLVLPVPASAQDDDYDLLPEAEGRDEVYAVCSGCHSIKLVIQQGLSRDVWDEVLDWMVADQGMPELDPETRGIVLDYLDRHLNTDHRPQYLRR